MANELEKLIEDVVKQTFEAIDSNSNTLDESSIESKMSVEEIEEETGFGNQEISLHLLDEGEIAGYAYSIIGNVESMTEEMKSRGLAGPHQLFDEVSEESPDEVVAYFGSIEIEDNQLKGLGHGRQLLDKMLSLLELHNPALTVLDVLPDKSMDKNRWIKTLSSRGFHKFDSTTMVKFNRQINETNAISAGGASLQPSGQVSGTGGNPLGRDMTDQYEIMWSGDKPEKKKKGQSLKEEFLDEEDLEEINALGTGAVVGYTLPLGMKPDYKTMDTKGKKKKRPRRWYDVHKESKLHENGIHRIRVHNDEGEQVATATIKMDGDNAILDSIIVMPDYRGQGIGKQLYKAANIEAKKKFGMPLTSSEFLTPHSRKMWKYLADEGLAKRVGDRYQMEDRELDEEFLGRKGGLSYYQMGGSLPDELYNRTDDGKPTRDPGIAGLSKKKKKKKK